MKNIRTPRIVTGFIAALLFLSASSAIADVNIGGNIIWHDADDGATIEILGPHPDLDIQALIDGIPDASDIKPYIIKLGAGIYDIGSTPIVMWHYVSIQGSGQLATIIKGAVGGGEDSGLVHGKSNVSLTDLTIINSGGSGVGHSIGINNHIAAPLINRVSVDVSGGNINTGISNINFSGPRIFNSNISTRGGAHTRGIFSRENSGAYLKDVTISSNKATSGNTGILHVNDGFFPMIIQLVSIDAEGGESAVGVDAQGGESAVENATVVKMENVTVRVFEGTSENVGVRINKSKVSMKDSTITAYGTTNSFDVKISKASETLIQKSDLKVEDGAKALFIGSESPLTRIVYNSIEGGVDNQLPPSVKLKEICHGNYDQKLAEVDCSTTTK